MIDESVRQQIEKIRERCEKIKPKLVILSLAYNHGPYIRESLDSFVNQKTNFPFVALIHDDASTDETKKILKEYAQKYPDIIFPVYQNENQYSKGLGIVSKTLLEMENSTEAPYIAMCECDDYWTDENKLQKQVDFLDNHPNIVLTCHRFSNRIENNIETKPEYNYIFEKHPEAQGYEFSLEDAFRNEWITKTLTLVYRRDAFKVGFLQGCKYNRDLHKVYNILSSGNGYCFNFNGGVYRKQETGVWSQKNNIERIKLLLKIWDEIHKKMKCKLSRKYLHHLRKDYVVCSLKDRKLPKISIKYLPRIVYVYIKDKYYQKYSNKKYKNLKIDFK